MTTEDNLSVMVDFARGATLSYALNAHSPWEGHRIAVEHAYRLPPDGRIGRAYVRANRPIIDHALIAGGVRLATIRDFALPGVDVISVGALTHSATAVDLSLDIQPARAPRR